MTSTKKMRKLHWLFPQVLSGFMDHFMKYPLLPLSVISYYVSMTLHIVLCTKKFKIWKLGKSTGPSFPFHVSILYQSAQTTEKPCNPLFCSCLQNIDKHGGAKDGEGQLGHCSGNSTVITQHISGVSVKKGRRVPKMDVGFGFWLKWK